MTMQVVDMPRASFTEDGSVVEMALRTSEDEEVTLRFSTDDFDRFVSRAVQLVNGARNQALSVGDHVRAHIISAIAVAAESPVGGSKVILSIRSDNGLPYHFAVEPDEAEQLRPQLYRAAKSVRRQGTQSRH